MHNKCAKIYNAGAQLLFCSLNLLFGDVFVPSSCWFALASYHLGQPGVLHVIRMRKTLKLMYLYFNKDLKRLSNLLQKSLNERKSSHKPVVQ